MQGLRLLTVSAGEMTGEHAAGFRAPTQVIEEDPAEASKQLVARRVQEKLQDVTSSHGLSLIHI